MINHKGNTQPSISQEEHEGSVTPYTKRVSVYGTDGTDKNALYIDGNGTMRSIVTIASTLTTTQGLVTLAASPNFIGLTTTVVGSAPTLFAVVNTAAAGQSSVVLDTGANWIGLATVNLGASIPAGTNAIGKLASNTGVDIGDVDILSIAAGNNNIGDVDVATLPALVAGTAQIGSVTIANQPPLTTGSAWIGLATVTGGIKNAGTTKTLEIKNIGISASGNATIFVPTTEFHVTHLLLSSDATVRVAILSGTTYLAGNASVGISLAPLGGFVENGSVDSPIYEGLANAAAFVINSSAAANIGGKVVYYEE